MGSGCWSHPLTLLPWPPRWPRWPTTTTWHRRLAVRPRQRPRASRSRAAPTRIWRCGARLRAGRSAPADERREPWSPAVGDHAHQGAGQHHDVEPQRPVLDVVVVEPDAIRDRRVPTEPVRLGPAGHAGRHAVAGVVAWHAVREALGEMGPLRARADQ